MSWTLRWVFILLPCVPGLTLLLAALGAAVASGSSPGIGHFGSEDSVRAQASLDRVWQLLIAGSAVLLAGVVIGTFVAWRIAHPRPDPADEDSQERPPTE